MFKSNCLLNEKEIHINKHIKFDNLSSINNFASSDITFSSDLNSKNFSSKNCVKKNNFLDLFYNEKTQSNSNEDVIIKLNELDFIGKKRKGSVNIFDESLEEENPINTPINFSTKKKKNKNENIMENNNKKDFKSLKKDKNEKFNVEEMMETPMKSINGINSYEFKNNLSKKIKSNKNLIKSKITDFFKEKKKNLNLISENNKFLNHTFNKSFFQKEFYFEDKKSKNNKIWNFNYDSVMDENLNNFNFVTENNKHNKNFIQFNKGNIKTIMEEIDNVKKFDNFSTLSCTKNELEDEEKRLHDELIFSGENNFLNNKNNFNFKKYENNQNIKQDNNKNTQNEKNNLINFNNNNLNFIDVDASELKTFSENIDYISSHNLSTFKNFSQNNINEKLTKTCFGKNISEVKDNNESVFLTENEVGYSCNKNKFPSISDSKEKMNLSLNENFIESNDNNNILRREKLNYVFSSKEKNIESEFFYKRNILEISEKNMIKIKENVNFLENSLTKSNLTENPNFVYEKNKNFKMNENSEEKDHKCNFLLNQNLLLEKEEQISILENDYINSLQNDTKKTFRYHLRSNRNLNFKKTRNVNEDKQRKKIRISLSKKKLRDDLIQKRNLINKKNLFNNTNNNLIKDYFNMENREERSLSDLSKKDKNSINIIEKEERYHNSNKKMLGNFVIENYLQNMSNKIHFCMNKNQENLNTTLNLNSNKKNQLDVNKNMLNLYNVKRGIYYFCLI